MRGKRLFKVFCPLQIVEDGFDMCRGFLYVRKRPAQPPAGTPGLHLAASCAEAFIDLISYRSIASVCFGGCGGISNLLLTSTVSGSCILLILYIDEAC